MRGVYDVIGDIHGHADALRRLLGELGYREGDGCWRHPERRAVFLGDFVDRGPAIADVLRVVRAMVEGGAALAILGNHELNAVAFHTPHPTRVEGFLRERSYKNIRQYLETVRQLTDAELESHVRWFMGLPLWLDLGGLRVVHACWHPPSMAVIERRARELGGTGERFFQRAFERDDELFDAVETVLKGLEVELPQGVSFRDKDGHKRHHVRARWFEDPAGKGYRDWAFSFSDELRAAVPDVPLPPAELERAHPYPSDAPPVLFGHYWMPPRLRPAPLAPNAACLDYSVAKGGLLCAYRWDGEAELDPARFVAVPASAR